MNVLVVNLSDGRRVEAVWDKKFSNFARACIELPSGLVAWSSESLYQAMKHPGNPELQRQILALEPKAAKRLARSVAIDLGWWDGIKLRAMAWAVRQKFAQNARLAERLLSTRDALIVEPSRFDRFWGAVQEDGRWVGKNWLGKILMQVRQELKEERLRPGEPPVSLP